MSKTIKNEIDTEKVRKVLLDSLPRWENQQYKGKINWKKCIGYKVKFVYDDIEGELEIVDYIQKGQYIIIKYKDNEPYKITITSLTKCNLGILLGIYTKDFRIEIGTIYNENKRNITILDRKHMTIRKNSKRIDKFYKYQCNICGWTDGWMEESSLLRGQGCSCCAKSTIVLGINTIWDTDKWMCDLGVSEEDAKNNTRGSDKFVTIKCPYCGIEKKKRLNDIYRNKSIACVCGDGIKYPEKFMFNILEQLLGENFIYQYSPNWVSPKRYDFYFEINNKKYIVETDGGWHKKDNNMSGRTAEESTRIDEYKTNLAKEHNIEVIRIDSQESELEYIKKNTIDSELNNIFNLNKIDWNKCEKFALSNLVKIVCDYKKNYPKITTTEIGKLLGLCRTTVVTYLKKGNKIGWVKYNSREEHDRVVRNSNRGFKLIEVFKDDMSLGVFNGAREIGRQSETLFGVKLNYKNISQVCKGDKHTHKGYVFKFVS